MIHTVEYKDQHTLSGYFIENQLIVCLNKGIEILPRRDFQVEIHEDKFDGATLVQRIDSSESIVVGRRHFSDYYYDLFELCEGKSDVDKFWFKIL